MINIETLLSSFDERGTLLKWLKAVEKALNEATLTSVDVITISSTEIKLKFIFEDDTTIETPTITLPKGDKGDTGATGETGEQGEPGEDGVGISNVTIDANNHLIVTLTDETEIDAGEIDVTSGVVVDSAISNTSENPVQNKVIYNALNSKASQADLTALTTRVGNVEGDIGTIEAQLTNKANASDVYTKTEANNLLAGKQNALTTSTVNDGTLDKSIGFDSQGNIVKGSAGGGGSSETKYNINVTNLHTCIFGFSNIGVIDVKIGSNAYTMGSANVFYFIGTESDGAYGIEIKSGSGLLVGFTSDGNRIQSNTIMRASTIIFYPSSDCNIEIIGSDF